MGIFSRKIKKEKVEITEQSTEQGVVIHLIPTEEEMEYGNVNGFFMFRNTLYYRTKGVAGRNVETDVSFTEDVKTKYPDEFAKMFTTGISKIKVQPLKVNLK